MNIDQTTNNDLLLVSDQKEELDDLVHLLKSRFGQPLTTLSLNEAVRIIKQDKPGVVIFAFRHVDAVRQAQPIFESALATLKLYRPQRVLMCKASESAQAFALYSDGLIDDFIADRPLYDPNRLHLSIAQALERRQYRLVSNDLIKVIENIDNDMHGLDRFVARLMETVDAEHHESIEMFHFLTRKMVHELEELHDGISRRQKEARAYDPADDDAALDNGNLNQTADWLVGLSRDYKKSHAEGGSDMPEAKPDSPKRPQAETSQQPRSQLHPTPPADDVATGKRVLVVDDDDFYRDVFVSMMQGSGFDIETADHGGTAIDLARRNPPDIILLDYKMPGIDGLEVLDILGSDPATRMVPVIMLTGISSKTIVDRSIRSGARDFIVKPGSRDVIIRKINDVIGGK
jgi:CheY-like chemotaxis protein